MGKGKRKQVEEPPDIVQDPQRAKGAIAENSGMKPAMDARPADGEPVYAFPTKSRCPRCNSDDTERTSQAEGTQYRRCRNPVCRTPYKVPGEPI